MKKIILLSRKNIIFVSLIAFLGLLLLFIKVNINKGQDQEFPFDKLISIEISSTEYPYFSFQAPEEDVYGLILGQKFKLTEEGRLNPGKVPPTKYYNIKFIMEADQELIINYSQILDLFYTDNLTTIDASSDFRVKVIRLISLYEEAAYNKYGLLLPWTEAEEIFPLFSIGKVIDMSTGSSFMVQRRAGSSHADVQPLTAKDTAAMKKIFGGSWTWNRKAIIVETGNYRIAASMNGMPHGSGKIADNNFPGHFCIHFLCSTTHTGSMDLQHQKEILKAAGKLPLD